MTPIQRPNPLSELIFASRARKPRQTGITMIADWGLSPRGQRERLATAGAYVDLAKIAVGISALLPMSILSDKLNSYRAHDIAAFPGGQFLEHALLHDKVDDWLSAVNESGFECIEVSDNILEIELEAKCAIIAKARRDYGLRVLGEVGKKEGRIATADLSDDARACLDAGAELVFLEAADFFAGEVDEEQIERVIEACGIAPLVFELPGPWIEGVTLSDVHRITCWLIDRFGTDVNIANVAPDDVLKVEALRLRIGVNAATSQSPT